MVPPALALRISEMRRVLERCCPAVASIRIRLSLQAITTLVERDARVSRALRLASHACLQYGRCEISEREQPRRDLGKIIDRLERSLIDARPSPAAVRLGRQW